MDKSTYINFYNYQRYQERYNSKAPMEIRMEAMNIVKPKQYPIAFNPRIAKYHELLNNLKTQSEYMEQQKIKYTCSKCGGIISIHDRECSECQEKMK